MTSTPQCDKMLPFCLFFFLTPLFFLIFPIQSAKRLDILAPYSDPLYKMPQGCVIPTTPGFHERFPHCQSCFASVCFLKEQPCLILWTMMWLLLSPSSRTVINFRACSAELDCIMHSTDVHCQNCTRRNVCKQNELLRLQNPRSSELILLANVHQRWVVKEVLFFRISEALCC